MYKYICLLLIFISQIALTQTPVSGIINHYTKIMAIESCEATLTVSDATNFAVDDLVIILQMQGATIAENDNSDFGNITDLGSAGLFEKAEILSVSGNEITLKKILVNEYAPNGNVQLISLPKYENATVDAPLTGQIWDGNIGGVVAIEVENTLTLEANITATGIGFRGGELMTVSSDCNFLTNANDYFYTTTNWRGSAKGEGIATPIAGKEHGRGAQATGGGGGNDHNTGGGGGGHIANGGQGGEQTPPSNFGCSGDHPGRGGKGILPSEERIFLGGGGGAGHSNNNSGTSGGNGGGIIIVFAGNLMAGGNNLVSNGLTPTLANGDGAGGGGAGGTVLLVTDNIMGVISLEANGGDGGDVNNPSDRCFGPGGGGAGGRILMNSANGTTSLIGGEAGINSTNSSQCNGLNNEAADGQEGSLGTISMIPQGDQDNETTEIIQQPESATICESDNYVLMSSVSGGNLSFQWQVNQGSGFEDVQNGANFSGANTSNLTIQNASLSLNNTEFRLLIIDNCSGNIISAIATLQVEEMVIPNFSFTNLGNGLIQFNNLSIHFNNLFWDFGDMNTSNETNPTNQYDEDGTYLVQLTAFGDCDTITISEIVEINSLPSAGFSFDSSGDCAPITVQFTNESTENATNFLWMFEGGLPALSSMENPTVSYANTGTFEVSLIVSNNIGSDTLTQSNIIQVQDIPIVDFSFLVNGLTVDFTNLVQNFSGDLSWDFGDNSPLNNEANPTHLFPNAGTFLVTLTATNDCGEISFSQEISTGSAPVAAFSSQTNSDCIPLTVFFSDQSSGQDITEWFWEFPGGNPVTSTEQNPEVTYSISGTYDVSLTITNSLGENTFTSNNHVVANAFPDAEFDYEITDFMVDFINNSVGGMTFTWNFGDGSPTSNAANPTHNYTSGGIYTVTLTASNLSCANVKSQEIFVDFVSTEEVFQAELFNVYPNPVQDILTIDFLENFGRKISIKLIDLSGKVMKEKSIQNAQNTEFKVAELTNGIYFLEIETERGRFVQKILKF